MDIGQIVPLIGDEELTAYRFLATTGGATLERLSRSLGWGPGRTERVLSRLRKMRLARSGAQGGSAWTAVHPETARLQYAKPLSGVIDVWQAQLEQLRHQLDTLSGLSGLCGEGAQDAGFGSVVTLEDASDIRDALRDCASGCTEEVLAVQPLGRGAPDFARDVVCRDPGPVGPDVGLRVLLPHLSRYDAEVRDCVERIAASGGEVRTTAASLPALLVFDRSVAVLLEGEETARAHLVKHPALVEFILHTVVSAWATSAPFPCAGGHQRLPESLTQETKSVIVQLLAAGYKDEVIARRMGIGVRTCRKYIAELFSELGAHSRFQAGWMVRDRMLRTGDGAVRPTGEEPVGDHTAA
ncbi:LuxR C-terminal-related transcriptional regulator [Streptomyces griseosporeus]|uniref:helix-turn-helix transcriptional regulator n=1 Tax=Streptomyces griseosporeus TaxID=1910 RepID=UPI003702C2BC